jgi:hypothetical protein
MKVELLGAVERRAVPEGFAARIAVGELIFGVSRLVGEEGWTVDSTAVAANSLPVHVNGYGARYLRTSQLVEAEAVAVLDAAAFEMATGEGRR